MIHDLDETLKQILIKRGKLNQNDIDIVFDQPTGEWAASLSRPTINLYLYDIRENLELRPSYQPEIDRSKRLATKTIPPRRIDLSYLITVWARNAEDEHQLLWRVLETLSRIKKIKPDEGTGTVRDQILDMPVKIALPSDAMRNLSDLWGVMENQLKPSINLTITAALDTEPEIESPLVFTAIFRVGQADPPTMEFTAHDTDIYHIGGRVLIKDVPVGSGAEVFLLNRGDRVNTDVSGQFIFAYIQPGEYDIEVSAEGYDPKRYKITVPSDNYDLSLA